MNELIDYLEVWKESKTKIFACENYNVSITNELDDKAKARYIELNTDKLKAKATLWESGELELVALDVESGKQVIQKSVNTPEIFQLDDELSWWLSEVAIY